MQCSSTSYRLQSFCNKYLHSDSKVEYLQTEEWQQVYWLAAGSAVDQEECDHQSTKGNQCTKIHIIYGK